MRTSLAHDVTSVSLYGSDGEKMMAEVEERRDQYYVCRSQLAFQDECMLMHFAKMMISCPSVNISPWSSLPCPNRLMLRYVIEKTEEGSNMDRSSELEG